MKQRTRDIIKVCLGILLAAAGFLLLRRPSEAQRDPGGSPLRLYRRGLWPLWPWCRRFAQSARLERRPRNPEATGN